MPGGPFFFFVFLPVFFLSPFSAAALCIFRGGPEHKGCAACFFGGQLPPSHARPYWAGRRDTSGASRTPANKSLMSGPGPSRLLRPGDGKQIKLSAKARDAAAASKPDQRCTYAPRKAGRSTAGAARALAWASQRTNSAASALQRPQTSAPRTTRRQRALPTSSG